MNLTSKQRAFLRSHATGQPAVCHIGKGDLSPALLKQVDDALTARELVKCSLQRGTSLSAREVQEALCAATGAWPVAVIGGTCSIYRPNSEKADGIVLPR